MESGGVPVMLNLVFYVLKVKQLKRIPLLISIHQIFLISEVILLRLSEFISNNQSSFKSCRGNIIISKNVNILRLCENIT